MDDELARAIQAELRRQGVLYEDGEDLTVLMMQTGEVADLTALIRVIKEHFDERTQS